MSKLLSCAEHLDAMHTYLEDMPDARHTKDWPRLHALAAAAQAHLSAADFLHRISDRPTGLDGRTGRRWLDAASVPGR